ncbi:MAG: hypothetical protein ABIH76_08620 [Candidatus Bathyarchaeota archaeon]
MPKHLLKIASYIDNEGFIYCPIKRNLELIRISFPLKCPLCGAVFNKKNEIKFVLEYEIL